MRESPYRAFPSDGGEILRVLESSAAKGSIELIYTRRPDAYDSYMKDAPEAQVFVSRDGDRIVGTCAELVREVYIGGEVRRAAYICGLKKDAEYDGGIGFGPALIRDLQQDSTDFYFCSVVTENTDARRMFEKTRRILSMDSLTGYKTFIINPKVNVKAPRHTLTFRRATEADADKLLAFLNTEGKKKDMFPVVKSPNDFYNLSWGDFCMLLDGENIIATAALWNQTAYKQYMVKRYGGIMKLARISNPLLSALRYVKLPKENEPLDFPMLSFFLVKEDDADLCRILLKEVAHVISRSYGMFVIGFPEDHFAFPILNQLPGISFETRIYGLQFPWSRQTYVIPDPHNAYFECGLL